MTAPLAILLIVMCLLNILLVIVHNKRVKALNEELESEKEMYQKKLGEYVQMECVVVSADCSENTDEVPKDIRKSLASKLGYAVIDKAAVFKDDSHGKLMWYASLRFKPKDV